MRIETPMMNGRTRKIALILAMALFAAFATQAILFAHLLLEGQHHQHDSQHCSLCQQLLTSSRSITTEQQTINVRAVFPERVFTAHIEIKPSTSANHACESRAPPFVS
jgi:hypothetical protein